MPGITPWSSLLSGYRNYPYHPTSMGGLWKFHEGGGGVANPKYLRV